MSCINFSRWLLIILWLSSGYIYAQVYLHAGSNRPTALISSAGCNKSVCIGSSVQIGGNPSALGGVGGYSYSWSPAVSLDNASLSNPLASPTVTTTYYLAVTDSLGCHSYSNITISVLIPVISISASDNYVSPGESTTLNATGAQNYSWSPSIGLNDTLGSQVLASPSENTTYYVLGTDSNGCTSSDSITVHVYCGVCPDSVIIASAGTFTNGCDNHVYNNYLHCKWVIIPSGASSIFISFPLANFDIDPSDTIKIWQGADSTGILKGVYNNDTLPPSIISTSVPMFVEFITDASNVANGFKANYWTDINGAVQESEDIITNFKVYPNPADGMINIEFSTNDNDVELKIFNILGQSVYTKNIRCITGKANEKIDVSTLTAGVYSVFLNSKNGSKRLTFIVE